MDNKSISFDEAIDQRLFKAVIVSFDNVADLKVRHIITERYKKCSIADRQQRVWE